MPRFTQQVSDGAGYQLRTVRLHHLTLKYKNIVRLQVSTSQMTSYTDKYYTAGLTVRGNAHSLYQKLTKSGVFTSWRQAGKGAWYLLVSTLLLF